MTDQLAISPPASSLKGQEPTQTIEAPDRSKYWVAAAVGAAALGGSALYNRAATRKAEAATPPAGKFVEIDGINLHYVDRGEGDAVVLLHGNAVMLQDFEASGVLDLVAASHRVLAFDRPGFGYSDRPRSTLWTPTAQARLIARALAKIGVDRAVVVGHSWGTLVALALALEEPERVAGLVLMAGYYYPTARPDVLPASLPAIPVIGDVMANTVSPLAGLALGPLGLKAGFAPAPISQKFAEFPKAMALRPSQMRASAAEGAIMIPAAAALSRRYGELDMPVTIMAGDGDLIVHPGRHAEPLAKDIAGAELQMVPGQGHFFHYAVPEQVSAAVDAVWARS